MGLVGFLSLWHATHKHASTHATHAHSQCYSCACVPLWFRTHVAASYSSTCIVACMLFSLFIECMCRESLSTFKETSDFCLRCVMLLIACYRFCLNSLRAVLVCAVRVCFAMPPTARMTADEKRIARERTLTHRCKSHGHVNPPRDASLQDNTNLINLH